MKYTRVGVLVVCIAVCAACGLNPSPASPSSVADVTGVVRLFGSHGIAHGCPVATTVLLTARHVAMRDDYTPVAMAWSDMTGQSGSAWTVAHDRRRDLAVMHSDAPFSRVYVIAAKQPAVGERVMIVGYSPSLLPRQILTSVSSVVAGHLVLENPGAPGFSGSCVLNMMSEVIGIFVWSVSMTQHKTVGVATAVWGPWSDLSWSRPE